MIELDVERADYMRKPGRVATLTIGPVVAWANTADEASFGCGWSLGPFYVEWSFGRRELVDDRLTMVPITKAQAAIDRSNGPKPCPIRSAITDQPCLLPLDHEQWKGAGDVGGPRWHKFAEPEKR